MLRVDQSLALNANAGEPMPNVPALKALYDIGCTPRRGELMMVGGYPGSQKSGFVMWLLEQWNIPTLYFSGDMTPFTAASRIASTRLGMTMDEVQVAMSDKGREGYGRSDVLSNVKESNIHFVYGPITWTKFSHAMDAFVETENQYPGIIVIDNLMNVEDCESDYAAQMQAMNYLAGIKTELSINIIVIHHASESFRSDNMPWAPPPRQAMKNKVGEMPELLLTVALDNRDNDFNICVAKQRSGKQDPTGHTYATLKAEPHLTRFHAHVRPLERSHE